MSPTDQSVRCLLHAAIRAGIAPGAVTAWGGGGVSDLTTVAAGQTEITAEGISQKASETTWYDLASLTKPLVTTTLFMLARRRHGIDFCTRVADLIDELPADRFPGNVTLESLLTHTSGLPAWAPLYLRGVGRRVVLPALAALKPVGPQGGQVVYSCPGFILLGLALERVYDVDFSTAFKRFVAQPLDLMTELSFNPDPDQNSVAGGPLTPSVEERFLREAGEDPAVIPVPGRGRPDDGNARALGGTSGNSGLFGTAVGVARLALEYVPGVGKLFSRAECVEATRVRTLPGFEHARALGWQVASTPGCSAGRSLGPSAFGHVGFTGTSVWVDPDRRLVLVLLTNRHYPGHRERDLHPLRRRFNTIVLAS